MKSHQGEWARFYRLSGYYPVDLVHARYVKHRFARHAHEHFVIGLVEDGVQQYRYRGSTLRTPAGAAFFVNSGEPHTGEPALPEGYLYRTLCFHPDVLSRFGARLRNPSTSLHFTESVVHDSELVRRLRRLHWEVRDRSSALANDWFLHEVMEWLLPAHMADRSVESNLGRESRRTKRLREYIDAKYADDVSLSQLGELVSASPFHIARIFAREVGLPPHAYLESVRIRRAMELLTAGMATAEVALAVGYGDQSHFSHRFRRLTGVTPGQVKAGTQDYTRHK